MTTKGAPEDPEPAPTSGGKLGTFAGVFTPSILTILGIILFLRMGFVVGNAGLTKSLVVIAIAYSISILTSFSLSAIATNFQVRGGGDYYLISRTLGPEFGGALGLVLFLAQSVSIAFYAIGFAEGATALIDADWLSPRIVAGLALLPLFALSWLGSDWATRFQYAIMAILTLAIGSFVWGALGKFDADTLSANWSSGGDMGFWVLFALFFPAVTGFTQGVSMSGELREPARSLPAGTFAAVAISLVIYVGVAVLFAGALPNGELAKDYDAMSRIAAVPALISIGIFAATLSSALASFLGAPRILKALAADKLFGFLGPFAKGTGDTGNPRRAVLLSFAIAAGTVAVGNLNVVAPVVSMFFLISYGLLNYATYYEATSSSPSFRPRFRWYHARLSLLGCLVCGGTMLAIDATAGAVALAVLMVIHQVLSRSKSPDRWADSGRSVQFQRVRDNLLAMSQTVEHDRDWRPVTLAFSDDPERRQSLLRFASWIEGGSGITTAIRIVRGSGALGRAEAARVAEELAAEARASELAVFTRVVNSEDMAEGFRTILQAAGIGPIRPNTALFNWFDHEGRAEDAPAMKAYGEYLRVALRHGCNVVVLAVLRDRLAELASTAKGRRRIDVWWSGDAGSRLSLLLAYLMTRGTAWGKARLRVLAPLAPEGSEESELADLRARLDEVRIPAEAVMVSDAGWASIAEHSRDASLAFVSFRIRTEGLLLASGEPAPASLEGLPPLVLVEAASDIELDPQPDQGAQAEQAQATDALADAVSRTKALRSEAEELRRAADAAAERLATLHAADTSPEELDAAAKEAERTEATATAAARKVAKVETKVLALEEDVESKSQP